MTLAEAYEAYLKPREGVRSPSTLAGYRRLQRNTFQRLMPMKLSSITSEHIQREIADMVQRGKSPKYVSNAKSLLSSVIRQAMPNQQYTLQLPAKRKPNLRRPDDKEIEAILTAFRGSPIELPVLMAMWMGMRLSEILGVRHEDIDGSKLHIRRAVVLDEKNRPVEKDSAKTYAGDRWVNIPAYISDLIAATGRNSGPLVAFSGAAIYKLFVRTLKKASIPRCRFHDLRHPYVTHTTKNKSLQKQKS